MKRLFAALLLFTSIGCEEPLPPPPPPKPPTPKVSLIPTAEQLKSVVNQLDKDIATEENSMLIQSAGDTRSRADTIAALVYGASSPKAKIRGNVAYIMELIAKKKIRDESMVDALLVMLDDPDSWVQIKAADALGKFCSKKAVPVLIARMEDKKLIDRVEAARQSLASMAGESVGKTAKDWKKWWEANEATFEEKCNAKP
jgi:HEAT repeat protein